MNKDNKDNKDNNSYNNNDHDNNEYNTKLYNSVFNNIVIKRIIFNHLNKFNILLPVNIEFQSFKEYKQFKYKDYLNTVTFDCGGYHLDQLVDNIRHIVVPPPGPIKFLYTYEIFNSIPSHIESLEFMESLESEALLDINNKVHSIPTVSTLKSLSFSLWGFKFLKDNIYIPPSITSLDIIGYDNHRIKKNQLPSNLKVLRFKKLNYFEDGCLPESLTSATFNELHNPLIINQFSLNGLVKLEFQYKGTIDSNIRFPNTLKELLITPCGSFNSILPSGLKSLTLEMDRFEYEIQFPSSLEYLNINWSNNILDQDVFKSSHSVPTNLKSLEYQCSSIVDSNGHSILPDTLESLTLLRHKLEIKENQLPSSLTHLRFEFSYQHAIAINVLPSGLKTLELPDSYAHVIDPLAIPPSLELLSVSRYNHPIHLTPSSHPNTAIKTDNVFSYYDPSNTDIRVLRLPNYFRDQLSKLQLQDKCNLNYLHIGHVFNQPIQLSDLPINNQIKILELGHDFAQSINLEHFQNLESIIIHHNDFSTEGLYPPTIKTTINDNGTYNYYKLKEIQILNSNRLFFKYLDINFYKFIRLIKAPLN